MDKEKRQKRFQQKSRHINRSVEIMRMVVPDHPYLKQPHRYHKVHAVNCGDSHCVMCGNPRKFFGEKTFQERKFECERIEYE